MLFVSCGRGGGVLVVCWCVPWGGCVHVCDNRIVVSCMAVVRMIIRYRPSQSYNARTEHVEFLPTRQTSLAPERDEALGCAPPVSTKGELHSTKITACEADFGTCWYLLQCVASSLRMKSVKFC